MPGDLSLRPAEKSDYTTLSALIDREYYIHRHLDWRPPLDWLGFQPYWLLYQGRQAMSALACPPDPPNVAWIRLFVTTVNLPPTNAWRPLFGKCLEALQDRPEVIIAGLALQRWFGELLTANGFQHSQDIVVLSWNNQLPPERPMPGELRLRPMTPEDLPQVADVDQSAFEPLWRNSLAGVTLAYQQSAYSTIVEKDGQIAGFQISTSTPLATHLARLAVLPSEQRQNIGYALVYDLFDFFRRNGSWQLTVNTQNDNTASLALYKTLGFELTGDSFPIFVYPR